MCLDSIMVCFHVPGSLEVTWEEIMVGVESGLLMFPINILIITIFRSIKPRFVQPKEKNHDMQGLKPLAVTMPTILKVLSLHFQNKVLLLCYSSAPYFVYNLQTLPSFIPFSCACLFSYL